MNQNQGYVAGFQAQIDRVVVLGLSALSSCLTLVNKHVTSAIIDAEPITRAGLWQLRQVPYN